MTELTAGDLRRVLDVVHALGDDGDGVELPVDALSRMGAMIGCDVTSATLVDHGGARLLGTVTDRPDQNLLRAPGFPAAATQHPGFAAHRQGRLRSGVAVALTDLLDGPSLRRLPLWVDYYRPRGTVDQLLAVADLGARRATVLTFGRPRAGFSTRDRAVVELLVPHLTQALTRRRRLTALAETARAATRHDRGRAALPALTAREREVAAQAATGATDQRIARALGISPRTVQKHLEQAYRKVGVGSRTELAAVLAAE